MKVKEPQPAEWARLRPGQVLFTYLHLAPDRAQTEGLMACGCTAIAYETVTDAQGGLPLLAPMSEVAGRMAVQVGARCLEKEAGGAGILLVGRAGRAAGARRDHRRRRGRARTPRASPTACARTSRCWTAIRACWPRSTSSSTALVDTLFATRDAIEHAVLDADLVIGAVLVPGAAAPRLVTRETVARMRPGSVMVDVAIDQGGCFETSRPTTHAEPTYVVDGVVHYCVTNMPGAVARTSRGGAEQRDAAFTCSWPTRAGSARCADNPHLAAGLNVTPGGSCTRRSPRRWRSGAG